jgi:3-oxoacyl-(acyl-carrier-protein) synthase/acyl carrier protein
MEFLEGTRVKPQSDTHTVLSSPVDKETLKDRTLLQLKSIFAQSSGMNADRIDDEEPLENYGIDSIMITQLNGKLSGFFKELSKTVFYEYRTLKDLAEHLISEFRDECINWTGLGTVEPINQKLLPQALGFSNGAAPTVSIRSGRKQNRILTGLNKNPKEREPIAIIGMSGRFPQADSLGEYWENLKSGKDCITEIPPVRWPVEDFYHPDPKEAVAQGKSYSKWGGFLDGFAQFDPLFFNILPREAVNMDPQERLFMESCWEVIEDAGYTREELSARFDGKVGVFAGITKTGYDLYGPDLWKQGEEIFPYTSFSSVANRISYVMNLHGPSMPVDTMCSSSLTAIHEACEHILRNECEMAIAGGVNLYLHPTSYTVLCAQQMLSRDGKCKSFGKGGNGFVPGEGVGAVLLKRLSKAVADGDHIYAVIRGSCVNHGGKTSGYTVPNPVAQGELIRSTLDKAGVNAREISYIEAHGTGTELGDPIEITGLSQAFRKDTHDTGYCIVGR